MNQGRKLGKTKRFSPSPPIKPRCAPDLNAMNGLVNSDPLFFELGLHVLDVHRVRVRSILQDKKIKNVKKIHRRKAKSGILDMFTDRLSEKKLLGNCRWALKMKERDRDREKKKDGERQRKRKKKRPDTKL